MLNDDSYDQVLYILYDDFGRHKSPNKQQDLYYTIQSLVLIYKNHPEWPEEIRTDMMQYVDKCVALLEKN